MLTKQISVSIKAYLFTMIANGFLLVLNARKSMLKHYNLDFFFCVYEVALHNKSIS